jgi:CBS domain containing-hemolysin-like protein
VILFFSCLLAAMLVFSAICSIIEVSLFSLSTSQLRAFKSSEESTARQIPELLSRPRDLLVTILCMNILANVLVQNAASNLFNSTQSWLFQVGVPIVLTLFFSDIMPRVMALQHNVALSKKVVPILLFFDRLLQPVRARIVYITHVISKLLFFFLKEKQEVPLRELVASLSPSDRDGLISKEEKELIEGFLELQEIQVREIMAPRSEILFFDLQEPLSRLIYLFAEEELGKVPVCEGKIDNVLGILSARDFLLHQEEIKECRDILPLLQKPFFIPETMLCKLLFHALQEKGQAMALAVDEYGVLSGLLTREDLVELVVGEIRDRRDAKQRYTLMEDKAVIASGKWELDEFASVFGCRLRSRRGAVTLGGWLTETWGDIPKTGTKIIAENFLFHVLAADPNRVRRVYIRRLG